MITGRAVWIRHSKDGWVPGTIKSQLELHKKFHVVAIDNNNNEHAFEMDQAGDNEFIAYRNESVDSQDDYLSQSVDNLINLRILNEPEILHCLITRYFNDLIYTYTGPILIALNPFKDLPALYSTEMIEIYYNFSLAKSNYLLEQLCITNPSPHIYGIATAAYTSMTSEITKRHLAPNRLHTQHKVDQSILISGESGAGKTESTKCILTYLTTITSIRNKGYSDESSVMDRVLESNPLLEAFGNAKTVRNNNSSRFGKYIELNFDENGFLIGGHLDTYMLEKVRLVKQHKEERNHHIFYQMLAGGSTDDKTRWGFYDGTSFIYLNGQKCSKNDADDFSRVQHAFAVLNFSDFERCAALSIAAGLMHLGQLKFTHGKDEDVSVISNSPLVVSSLKSASQLLGVTIEALIAATTLKSTYAQLEKFVNPINAHMAADARDALAKVVYSALFDWIVSMVNKKLHPVGCTTTAANIGVLDIFGFEIFQNNSFEQLCINYANENLQHQFNKYVFELEQVEYETEGIDWSFIDYPSNHSCLELLEHKVKGIFATLDDECYIPKGGDMKFAQRLYQTVNSPNFSFSASQKNRGEFCIRHYAGEVVYSVVGFTDKNKNEVPRDATELFSTSSVPLIAQLFSEPLASRSTSFSSVEISRSRSTSLGRSQQRTTVCSNFKEQLSLLLDRVNKTKPHYVRCIKPKETAAHFEINRLRVLEQLKCGGILEAVKVARSGFPLRMTHQEFFNRYRILSTLKQESKRKNLKEICQQLLLDAKIIINTSDVTADVQFGISKVFLPQDAYDRLEEARVLMVQRGAVVIQAKFRGMKSRSWYIRVRGAAIRIQRNIRSFHLRVHIGRLVNVSRQNKLIKSKSIIKSLGDESIDKRNEVLHFPLGPIGKIQLQQPGRVDYSNCMERIPSFNKYHPPNENKSKMRTFSRKNLSMTSPCNQSTKSLKSMSNDDLTRLNVPHTKLILQPSVISEPHIRNAGFPSIWSTAKLLSYFTRSPTVDETPTISRRRSRRAPSIDEIRKIRTAALMEQSISYRNRSKDN